MALQNSSTDMWIAYFENANLSKSGFYYDGNINIGFGNDNLYKQPCERNLLGRR